MASATLTAVAAARVLIVGYGNSLRGDDGLGPFIVERLTPRRDDVTTRTMVQLAPELAEELANVDAAIFVDACLGSDDDVRVRPVEARQTTEGFSHVADVEALLGLTRGLFGRAPQAWLVSVAGRDFALREGLSFEALANAGLAARKIGELLASIPHGDGEVTGMFPHA